MPEYSPGTPSWIELTSPDTDASADFYGRVFGWEATEPGPAETGGYRMFVSGGKTVAGLMGRMEENQPTAWSTYVSVENADETMRRALEAGGSEIVAPMDVMDLGRMAFFLDPTGAAIGIWQAGSFGGADLVNEPVSLVWNELYTHETDRAKTFYKSVFGWDDARPTFDGAPDSYTVWELDGHPVGGMMDMAEGSFPAGTPPHWGVCFAVTDADEAVAAVRDCGGTVAVEPVDMPIGRFAALIDPHGTAFTVMQTAAG